MGDIGLTSLQLDLVDLAAAHKCEQSAASNVRVAPMGQTQLCVVLRLQRQGLAGPCQQCLPLRYDPVLPAIEVHCDD